MLNRNFHLAANITLDLKVLTSTERSSGFPFALLFTLLAVMPRQLHSPNAERAHVSDCTVVVLLIESFWCFKTHPDSVIDGIKQSSSSQESFFLHVLDNKSMLVPYPSVVLIYGVASTEHK